MILYSLLFLLYYFVLPVQIDEGVLNDDMHILWPLINSDPASLIDLLLVNYFSFVFFFWVYFSTLLSAKAAAVEVNGGRQEFQFESSSLKQ